jgi:F1F0 ATPase subunit 2
MNDTLTLVLVWLTGAVLGTIFFGGLWWTVRKGLSSRQPAIWFFGSLLLRMFVTLGGFYLVGHDHWKRLLVCLLGFVMARLVVTRLNRPTDESETRATQEAGNAS